MRCGSWAAMPASSSLARWGLPGDDMSKDFRNYIYVSQTKLEQYIGQLDPARLSKVGTDTKIKTPLFEHSVKTEFEGTSNKYKQLGEVVREVERRGLIGDLLDYKPWFRATVRVRVGFQKVGTLSA